MLNHFHDTMAFARLIERDVSETGFAPSQYGILLTFSSIMLYESTPQIYRIDNSLIDLLFNTKNQIFPRKTPYKNLFLNVDFKFNKLDVKGIVISFSAFPKDEERNRYWDGIGRLSEDRAGSFLIDTKIKEYCKKGLLDGNMFEKDPKAFMEKFSILTQKEGIMNHIDNFKVEDLKEERFGLFIFTWGYDNSDNTGFFISEPLLPTMKQNVYEERVLETRKKLAKSYYEDFTLDMNDVDKLSKSIQLFVCNFLDFINNPEVKIVNHPINATRNKKRAIRGKDLIPEYNDIRITGELKKYIGKPKNRKISEERRFDHKYWVSGHFRRFWNKEKYKNMYRKHQEKQLSAKYYYDDVNNVLMTWMLPYVKGKGILVSKTHLLTKPGGNND